MPPAHSSTPATRRVTCAFGADGFGALCFIRVLAFLYFSRPWTQRLHAIGARDDAANSRCGRQNKGTADLVRRLTREPEMERASSGPGAAAVAAVHRGVDLARAALGKTSAADQFIPDLVAAFGLEFHIQLDFLGIGVGTAEASEVTRT